MRTDELDFDLPEALIATTPAEPRDSARLMVIHRAENRVEHRRVRDLPDLGVFAPGDLMVVNQTRVLPAYFECTRVSTGGRVTGLYLDTDPTGGWQVLLETRGKPGAGECLALDAETVLRLEERTGPGAWRVRPRHAEGGEPLSVDVALGVLQRVGRPPLPPYIRRARKQLGLPEFNADDAQSYNTVFAEDAGSVAAPTAGLHFTPGLLACLDNRGVRRAAVTLNVGIGTFTPVRSDTLDGHAMHAERYTVPADTLGAIRATRRGGGAVLVVGTTTVRTLESLPHPLPDEGGEMAGETDLFIRPDTGFTFRHTDRLMTNFHLPRSTLLAMVAALPGVGLPRLLDWYREAIAEGYRFYSYGDAMLLV